MLVLNRYPGEQIIIGSDIVVSVIRVSGADGGTVRLGIVAPRATDVRRMERGPISPPMPVK